MMVRIVLHSGVADFAPTRAEEIRIANAMRVARDRGEAVLLAGGSCIDAVVAAIAYMEDCGLFNAGKGAVKSEKGTVELDSAIMEGETGNWGAIGFAQGVRNPIRTARNVMDKEGKLLIVGPGASNYDPDKHNSRERANSLVFNLGTVGCVALDSYGNMCAGISSGGAFDKRSGRLGGACIIGTEIYCDNDTVAVSGSGVGESFIEHCTAAAVHYGIKRGGMTTRQACKAAVSEMPSGSCGIICIDRKGHVVVIHNCLRFYTIFNSRRGKEPSAMPRAVVAHETSRSIRQQGLSRDHDSSSPLALDGIRQDNSLDDDVSPLAKRV